MYYLWVCVSNGLHSDFFNSFFFKSIFSSFIHVCFFLFSLLWKENVVDKKANCPQCQLILILKYEWSSRVLPLCTTNIEIVLTTLLYACTKKDKARNGLEKKKSINNDAVFSQIQLQSNYYNTYLWTEDEFFNVLDNHDELIFTLPEHVI